MTLPAFTKLMAAVCPDSTTIDPADFRAWGLAVETALNALITRTQLINGYFAASVAGNVLTVAVKTNAGVDPSSLDPVYADFRSVTPTSGAPGLVAITAALSMTVSAGSTVGFANAVPGRLWVVLFNNAGTPALGIFNAYGGNTAGATGSLFPLMPSLVATTTAEGGAGAADSAGVIYTPAALTSKAFIVLGHMTWETALATAGSWSAAPDVVHQQRLGDLLPGNLVQRQLLNDGALATGTTTTPLDDTIPQNTEGSQFASLAITPASKANVLSLSHVANYASSVAAQVIAALFQDSTANALVAKAVKVTAAGDDQVISLSYEMIAATAAATTFKVRAGPSTAATVTYNGSAGARLFGGVNIARFELLERMG